MNKIYKLFLLFITCICAINFSSSAQSYEQSRIYNNAGDRKMMAYPVPAQSTVYIKLSPALRAEAKTVELVSVIGRVVAVQRINAGDGDEIVFNGLSQLPEGVYIGVTKNADGKTLQTTKLIIQR